MSSTEQHADGPRYGAARLRLHPGIRLPSAVPEVRSSTAEARVLLPEQVAHTDARFNLEPGGFVGGGPH